MTNKPSAFSQMRKQSANLSTLQDKIKNNGKKDYSDDRFWRAEQDKAGNASAVIRFLPASLNEEDAFVKLWSFGFKGSTGQWFIENSPTTIGNPCPVTEANNLLWATKDPEDEKLARERKRRLSYISNIYVVSDPANPENEGKVFLFKYGVKLFEKIENAMVPKYEEDAAVNVFDPWVGANFKLRIAKKDGYANYDNSIFEAPSQLAKEDDAIEAIWNQQHALKTFIAPDQFKTYDELKVKFDRTVGTSAYNAPSQTVEESITDVTDENEATAVDSVEIDEMDLEDFKALVE